MTSPFVPFAPVKYCGLLKIKVPAPAFTMPCVVFVIDELKFNVVLEPSTCKSMVIPPLCN